MSRTPACDLTRMVTGFNYLHYVVFTLLHFCPFQKPHTYLNPNADSNFLLRCLSCTPCQGKKKFFLTVNYLWFDWSFQWWAVIFQNEIGHCYFSHAVVWSLFLSFWFSQLTYRSSCGIPRWMAIAGKFCSTRSWARATHRWTDFTKITTWTTQKYTHSAAVSISILNFAPI